MKMQNTYNLMQNTNNSNSVLIQRLKNSRDSHTQNFKKCVFSLKKAFGFKTSSHNLGGRSHKLKLGDSAIQRLNLRSRINHVKS